ncbi:MAG: stage II sporulation protein M [Clostridia bacterium]|nr:stage II sporulation protein M [Clostridia bacterium]
MTIKAINFKKINSLRNESDREVKGMIITLALFAAAMIIGSGTLKNTSDYIGDYSDIFNSYIIMRSDEKIYTVFFNSVSVNLFFILLINFAGLSCVGIPLTVFIILIKGLGFGFFSGFLFSEFSMSGIGYYLITVLPGAVISNTAILLACNNSAFMSADILAVTLSKKQPDENIVKNYLKKSTLITAICIIASIIDSVLAKAFEFMFVF